MLTSWLSRFTSLLVYNTSGLHTASYSSKLKTLKSEKTILVFGIDETLGCPFLVQVLWHIHIYRFFSSLPCITNKFCIQICHKTVYVWAAKEDNFDTFHEHSNILKQVRGSLKILWHGPFVAGDSEAIRGFKSGATENLMKTAVLWQSQNDYP